MSETLDVRRCTEDDLVEVAALFERWQHEDAVWGLRAEPVERLRTRMGEFFLVARSEGRVVGFAVGKVDREPFCVFPAGESYLEIEDVYVAPEHRRRGVGAALVESLLKAAEAGGIPRFHLYSASRDWQRSMRFYERFGFRVWSFQMFKK